MSFWINFHNADSKKSWLKFGGVPESGGTLTVDLPESKIKGFDHKASYCFVAGLWEVGTVVELYSKGWFYITSIGFNKYYKCNGNVPIITNLNLNFCIAVRWLVWNHFKAAQSAGFSGFICLDPTEMSWKCGAYLSLLLYLDLPWLQPKAEFLLLTDTFLSIKTVMTLQQDKGLLSSLQKNLHVSPTLPLYWDSMRSFYELS